MTEALKSKTSQICFLITTERLVYQPRKQEIRSSVKSEIFCTKYSGKENLSLGGIRTWGVTIQLYKSES